MALTRKQLKAMGLTDEQVDSVIEMHTETVDGLKKQVDEYKEAAEKLGGVQKELDALKGENGGYKDKFDALNKEYEAYKSAQGLKEKRTSQEAAARAYLESHGIKGANLNIALRGMKGEIDGIEIEDGKIKDAKALDALIAGDYAGLVTRTDEEHGKPPATPPKGSDGIGAARTLADALREMYGT